MVQQVIAIMPDGSVIHGTPCGKGEQLESPSIPYHSFQSNMQGLPVWARVVLVFFHALTLTAFTVVVLNVLWSVLKMFTRTNGYSSLASSDEGSIKEAEVKQAAMVAQSTQIDCLPEYVPPLEQKETQTAANSSESKHTQSS